MHGCGPEVIDLFAGAGLLSYAFTQEGLRVIQAVEHDSVAAKTYAHNLGNHIVVGDVRTIRPTSACQVLIAGPPCQGFSTLNRARAGDPRNALALEVVKWADTCKPEVVVVENVAAFLRSSESVILNHSLESLGYDVSTHVLNAYDFGVPQVRVRSFTIASRRGAPSITPLRTRIRCVAEAWDGLPVHPDGVNNHYAPDPSPLALARMKLIPPEGDKRDLMRSAPHLSPQSWWSIINQATDCWGRLGWRRPANTLRTSLINPSKGRYIHPDQNRVMSLREAARLHTVPDSWYFHGRPTQVARQIGNGVPPLLGRAIARSVAALM